MYYFDYAATTPVSLLAQQATLTELQSGWANPSAQYEEGLAMEKKIQGWRSTVATALGCLEEEFYFTSCGTESNNWAILMGAQLGRHRGKHCVTTTVEHLSVKNCFQYLEKNGYTITYLKPNKQGQIAPEQVAEAVTPETALVSVMMVNNETGILFPVEEMAQAVKAVNPNTLFHSDGIQGFLKVPFHLGQGTGEEYRKLNIDLLSLSGHKIYAPKGVGGLFIRKGVKLPPLLHGGGQEKGLRPGTQATAQMAALAAATQEYSDFFLNNDYIIQSLKMQILGEIEKIEGIVPILDPETPTAPHILPISLVGYPSEVVVRFLSDQGICVSAGSACHKGAASHVFASLPLEKKERIGIIRLSLSHNTTQDEVVALVAGLRKAKEDLVPSF